MKIKRSRKALSPVVASIILIAVTVAVSIAVAAWMGALTFNFMGTEQISITYADFGGLTPSTTLMVNVTNTGSSAVIINSATVNGVATTITSSPVTVPGNTPTMKITLALGSDWVNGYTYNIKLSSQKGNSFTYTAVAPSG